MRRIEEAIGCEPWLIEPGALERITLIAQRLNDAPDFDALAMKIGRPLDHSQAADVYGNTAVIPITGPIFRYANLFTKISGATSLEILARDFQTALDNPAVKQIVLSIDSPGGQATGIAEFAGHVKASPKPVTAYVGDLAASAAYWIASAASTIIVSPTALLGSIGVVMTHRPPSLRPGEQPVIEVISSQSPLKHADPSTEAGRIEAQRIVDQLDEVFVKQVASARGVSEGKVMADFGRGSLLVGTHAVAAGMADRIGTLASLTGTPGPRGAALIAQAEAAILAQVAGKPINLPARPAPEQPPAISLSDKAREAERSIFEQVQRGKQ